MWEIWAWDGNKIQGKLLKKYKKKESAISYAKKHIDFKFIEQNKNSKNEYFLDDRDHRAVGIIKGSISQEGALLTGRGNIQWKTLRVGRKGIWLLD